MLTQVEKTILSAYNNLEYFNRATSAHIKPDFFETDVAQTLAKECIAYSVSHKTLPTKTVLMTIMQEKHGIREAFYQDTLTVIDAIFDAETIKDIQSTDSKWLLGIAENWCIERSAFNAVLKSMDILEGKEKGLTKSAIPELLQKAISIAFDSRIGHDYINDNDARYEHMHSPVAKIPFSIPILNTITNGGIERKGITILVCPPHAGKSLTMASWGCDWLRLGYNVLVITMEMSEFKIGERMDANMLDIDIGSLKTLPKAKWDKKFKEFKESGYGRLIIREYPMSSAGSSHFRFLLKELETKEDFKPDVVIVDYMGICISTQVKSDNMYKVQKAVGEELRALAQEIDFAMVTAVQTNKDGFGGADFDMGDISESSGHSHTGDLILGLISTDELIQLGQVRVKQLKNRYGSIHDNSSFILNMDRRKMKVWQNGEKYIPPSRKNEDNVSNNIDTDKPLNSFGGDDEDDNDTPFVFNRSMIRPKKNIDTSEFKL